MTFDKRDIAIIKAASLVGYCESAAFLLAEKEPNWEAWVKKLAIYTNGTGSAIAACWSEPITQPSVAISEDK